MNINNYFAGGEFVDKIVDLQSWLFLPSTEYVVLFMILVSLDCIHLLEIPNSNLTININKNLEKTTQTKHVRIIDLKRFTTIITAEFNEATLYKILDRQMRI